MESLSKRLKAADALLMPYAVKHGDGLGRMHTEADDATRFRFQRDRARIVHSREFRRLKGKTQVFVGGGGDHYRTRLTHTLEVVGISRDIARTLGLNEDLAECIALAHDLGHPPFGHAGEAALDEWMGQYEKTFEHNLQSYRIVTLLSKYSESQAGLNLNREVLEGLLKHVTESDKVNEYSIDRAPSLEAQVVNFADEIAYCAHDLEDGLRAGLIAQKSLRDITLIEEGEKAASKKQTSLRGAIVNILINDLYQETACILDDQDIKTLDDVYAAKVSLVGFSSKRRSETDQLRGFLWDQMYNHPAVLRRSNAGKLIIRSLCDHLYDHPSASMQEYIDKGFTSDEATKDFIAGMTDQYAFEQAENAGLLTGESELLAD